MHGASFNAVVCNALAGSMCAAAAGRDAAKPFGSDVLEDHGVACGGSRGLSEDVLWDVI